MKPDKDDLMPDSRDPMPQRELDIALQDRDPAAERKIFVDFDHTLFACNSTELFIASCRPAFLAAAIDFLVRDCIPWRLTGLPRWFRLRDFVCCLLILLVMPWTWWQWRRQAPALFARHESAAVRRSLERLPPDKLVLVSFGMRFILRALLRGSRWDSTPLIATRLWSGPRHFARGKMALLGDHFTAEEIASATAISDSDDDRDLLTGVQLGILIAPQGGRFRAAEQRYVPLRYTTQAKYGALHMLDKVLLIDLAILVLGSSRDIDDMLRRLLCMPFLVLSLVCVYEMGYYENDMVAARTEAKPTLTAASQRFLSYPIQPAAWIWAIGLGIAGCGAAALTRSISTLALGPAILAWVILLVLLRLVFLLYNQQPVRSRIMLYPLLQLMKFLPVFFLIHPTGMGVLLALSQVATMWVVYILYRLGGDAQQLNKELFRSVLLAVGMVLLATTGRFTLEGSLLPVSLIALWCLARLSKASLLDLVRRHRAAAMGPAE